MNRWGDATPADLARVMAGDSLLADPTYSGTVAVTISARAEHIWPRLVQIGYLLIYAIEPAGFVMTRRMVLGLKQRAEALRAANTGNTRANQRPAA